MKRLMIAFLVLAFAGSAAACPVKGSHIHGGTGSHHSGGTCY